MAEMTLAAVARALEVRADQPGVFSGYASLFGSADNQGDRVEPGAFRSSLETWRSRGRRPAMLWQHNPSEPIGLWTGIEEDAVGLRVEGRLLLSVRAGAEAYEHIKAGTVTGLSIGYQAVEARRDRKSGLRRLVRVNLWEISLVTFPANHEARVATVKEEDLPDARTRLTRSLRRLILTRPILPFLDRASGRKNAVNYQRLHGRPQPRDDAGQFGHGAGGARMAQFANRPAAPRPREPVKSPAPEAPMAEVNWDFIRREEGGQRLDGYVPENKKKEPLRNSGVTVATGLDLGSHNEEDLKRLGIPPATIDKLRPYLRLKGQDAKDKLAQQERAGTPLVLSKVEADTIDELKRADVYRKVRSSYNNAIPAGKVSFDEIPVEARTAILSVAFQYGPNFRVVRRGFWKSILSQDWEAAYRSVRNFRDPHPERRKREAGLFSGVLRGDMIF